MTQISPVSKAKKVMISFGCAFLACWRISSDDPYLILTPALIPNESIILQRNWHH